MTREELEAIVAAEELKISQAREKIVQANKELALFKATDKESANKQLALISDSIQELWNRARDICNEFHLEFSWEDDEGTGAYMEMDIYEYGMWAHSSC